MDVWGKISQVRGDLIKQDFRDMIIDIRCWTASDIYSVQNLNIFTDSDGLFEGSEDSSLLDMFKKSLFRQ